MQQDCEKTKLMATVIANLEPYLTNFMARRIAMQKLGRILFKIIKNQIISGHLVPLKYMYGWVILYNQHFFTFTNMYCEA